MTTTTSLEGKLTAKLEIELGKPTDARPGAPSPHLRTAFSSQCGAPASGAARRSCHRGPAAKAKSRARAAAYQAAKAAAVLAAQELESESTPATPASGGSSSAPSAPLAAPNPLNILPSPPASDGRRLVVSVGKGERLPSFSQLDGQDDATLSSQTSAEVDDDIIDINDDDRGDAATPFCQKYKDPPSKVQHPMHGIGTFQGIDSTSGHCVYNFPNATSIMWYSVEI